MALLVSDKIQRNFTDEHSTACGLLKRMKIIKAALQGRMEKLVGPGMRCKLKIRKRRAILAENLVSFLHDNRFHAVSESTHNQIALPHFNDSLTTIHALPDKAYNITHVNCITHYVQFAMVKLLLSWEKVRTGARDFSWVRMLAGWKGQQSRLKKTVLLHALPTK